MKHKELFIFTLITTLLISCSSIKNIADKTLWKKYRYDIISDYTPINNHEGYRNIIVIDKIHIDTPIVVITANRHKMIMPYSSYISLNDKESSLFERSDIFLFEYYLPYAFFRAQIDDQILINEHHSEFYKEYDDYYNYRTYKLPTPKQRWLNSAYMFLDEDIIFYVILVSKRKYLNYFYDIWHGDVYPKLTCQDYDYIRLLVPAMK